MAKLTQQELERHLWGAADILRGTVDAGVIEIQGDHRDLLVEELGRLGYTVRRSGG